MYPPPSSWLFQSASRDSTRYAAVFIAVLVAHAVEEVELELRPPQAGLADPRGAQELLGPRRERPRVVGEGLARVGLEGGAEEADRRRLPEGVEEGGPELGDEDEVARLHGGEAERRAVEADPGLHEAGVEAGRRGA